MSRGTSRDLMSSGVPDMTVCEAYRHAVSFAIASGDATLRALSSFPASPPDRRAFDVLCMGRSCIDLYAHEIGVPITAVRSFDAYVGGCATNVSVGTRRLGLRSALLTGVGTDQVGDFVLNFLNGE